MDIIQRQGNYPVPAGASSILGVEFSGTVEGAGSEAGAWKVGDEVLGLASGVSLSFTEHISVAEMANRRLSHFSLLSVLWWMSMGGQGAYAEYIVLLGTHLLHKPKHLSWVEAASIPENFLTGMFNLPNSPRDVIAFSTPPMLRNCVPYNLLHLTWTVWQPLCGTCSFPGPLPSRRLQEGRERHDPRWSLGRGRCCYSTVSLFRRVSALHFFLSLGNVCPYAAHSPTPARPVYPQTLHPTISDSVFSCGSFCPAPL